MEKVLNKVKTGLLGAFMTLTGVWLMFALSFQIFCVYLELTNQDERMSKIANEISWKIDGTFKDNPDNIWYNK